jgi:hypothetical protein
MLDDSKNRNSITVSWNPVHLSITSENNETEKSFKYLNVFNEIDMLRKVTHIITCFVK